MITQNSRKHQMTAEMAEASCNNALLPLTTITAPLVSVTPPPSVDMGHTDDTEGVLIQSGSMLQYKQPRPFMDMNKPSGGTRGFIRGRSSASRRRFQETMARVDLKRCHGIMLITLTWAIVPPHGIQQRFRDSFSKWIDYHFKGSTVAWAKERGKKNGRWHYHMVIFATTWFDAMSYQSAWNRIAGEYAGNVDVKLKTDAQAVRYLAKYMSKEVGTWTNDGTGVETSEPEAPARSEARTAEPEAEAGAVDLGTAHISPKEYHTGRTWGWRRYHKLPFTDTETYVIRASVAHKLRRVVRNSIRADKKAHHDQWRAWNDHISQGRGVPADAKWIKQAARNKRVGVKAYAQYHFESSFRDMVRAKTRSHLSRGGFDKHGFSCFIDCDIERLVSFFSEGPNEMQGINYVSDGLVAFLTATA